jgi:hypothetical protein
LGTTYIAVAKQFENVKWLVGVFCCRKKFIYGCRWIDWIANNTLSSVFEKRQDGWTFYASYGINDWLFLSSLP